MERKIAPISLLTLKINMQRNFYRIVMSNCEGGCETIILKRLSENGKKLSFPLVRFNNNKEKHNIDLKPVST